MQTAGAHLTYCTNIHPGESWDEVFENVRTHVLAVKARVAPREAFGVGLRLSALAARSLREPGRLGAFKQFLAEHQLYVFTINGFPYGPFHGERVKAAVYRPDWSHDERVDYTLRLAEILSALLPDGVDGTISTSPLSYKAWDADLETCTANVRRVDEGLRGTRIALAIEPEADGSLATVDELIAWWPDGLENVTICFDACHSAVAYEEPEEALAALDEAGIRIGKAQLSAALRLPVIARAELERFADPIYLHQVTQRSADGSLQSWPDLPQALDGYGGGEEWRVHFHVPIFLERYGKLESTQDHLREVISRVRDRTSHLEIETYTWDVLPAELKASSVESIAREYEWVLDVLR